MADEANIDTGVQVVEEATGETAVLDTPAEETPAEETPAEETPAEETPAEETPAEGTPDEGTSGDEDFIRVALSEGAEFMEFAKEDDGTVIFSTIKAQFPTAVGLKHKGTSGAWRAVRDVDGKLVAPKEGWGNQVYIISVPDKAAEVKEGTRKRKNDTASDEGGKRKVPKEDQKYMRDLPVTNIPFECTVQELRKYFENKYGSVGLCQIKTEPGSKKSRGFGFIRFSNAETAKEAVNDSHEIMGRKFYVKLKAESPFKLFVGMLPKDIKKQELEDYFSQFGDVNDVYLPKPFRNFGFVIFSQKHDALKVIKKQHKLKGRNLNVEEASPDMNQPGSGGGGGQGQFSGGGFAGYSNQYPPQYPSRNEGAYGRGTNAGVRGRGAPSGGFNIGRGGGYGGGHGGIYGGVSGGYAGGPGGIAYGGGPGGPGGPGYGGGQYGNKSVQAGLKAMIYDYLGGGGGY